MSSKLFGGVAPLPCGGMRAVYADFQSLPRIQEYGVKWFEIASRCFFNVDSRQEHAGMTRLRGATTRQAKVDVFVFVELFL